MAKATSYLRRLLFWRSRKGSKSPIQCGDGSAGLLVVPIEARVSGTGRKSFGGLTTTMTTIATRTILGAAVAALSLATLAAPASAGDLFGRRDKAGSIKDAPAEEPKRLCNFSFNIGGTTDYVFRGLSQHYDQDVVAQGGLDATCGLFYAGVWASGVDFYPGNNLAGDASVEIDLYAGIKPTWGPLTFDFGVIYYWYPGANDGAIGPEVDYVELKAGVSGTWNNLTLGGTIFYSPDYTTETGDTITLEGSAGYAFKAIGPVTPSITGVIGTVLGDDPAFDAAFGGDYVYWNLGLVLAVDKFTFDFRYWDSNNDSPVWAGLNDERFVFTAKVTLP